tara:strand:+ start:745 stop:933 length:189 start_codon:yes stop_codon:yes gene_type:complete
MISLGFEKKIAKIVMNLIDKTIGKKFPIIDKITDMFQEQDHKMQELERKIDAIESVLKEENQ